MLNMLVNTTLSSMQYLILNIFPLLSIQITKMNSIFIMISSKTNMDEDDVIMKFSSHYLLDKYKYHDCSLYQLASIFV